MQTSLQFGNPSTFQEWSNFKGILNQVKKTEKPLLKNGNSSESLVIHLAQQLDGSGIIKGFGETEIITLPSFSENVSIKKAV